MRRLLLRATLLLLCVACVSCAAVATVLVWRDAAGAAGAATKEPFFFFEEPLTSTGQLHGDPTLCTLWPSGYSFASEGLVEHPTSSASDPKCVLVRDGMGLLTNDIAGMSKGGVETDVSALPDACTPTPDKPELHWLNPLNQAGNGGVIAKLYAENIAGIDRCVISLSPGASSEDLMEVDVALSIAGAQARSQLPVVLHQLEATTASLSKVTKALDAATAQLGSASGQIAADAAAVSACQSDVRQSEVQLEALAASSESAMASAVSAFKQQYASMQETSHQRLSARITKDEAALASAVAAQKATDEAACAARVAAAKPPPAPPPPPAAAAGPRPPPAAKEIRSKLRDNFCVDVKGGSKDAVAEVFMYDCLNQDNQRLTYDGGRRMVSKNSGMCLNVNGGSTENGARIIQYPCSDTPNQLWTLKGDGTVRPDHAPEKCLDVFGLHTENESKLTLWNCNGGVNQQFAF
jgi:hypothetical protein